MTAFLLDMILYWFPLVKQRILNRIAIYSCLSLEMIDASTIRLKADNKNVVEEQEYLRSFRFC